MRGLNRVINNPTNRKVSSMAGIEEYARKMDIKATMLTLIVSAFGFVAALFWRDAVQSMLNAFLPEGGGLFYRFAAAIIVTIIAVIVIYLASRHMEGKE